MKNDVGKLTITDGVITSGDQALQNWSQATVKGGTLNGGVYTWAMQGAPDGYEFLTVIEGGTINGNDQALQNWSQATVKGGTLNGGVYTWAMQGAPDGYEFLTVIEGGTINGNVVAVNYDGSDATAQIVVSGPAQINGDVAAYDRSSGSLQPVENGDGVLIQISDGTFLRG